MLGVESATEVNTRRSRGQAYSGGGRAVHAQTSGIMNVVPRAASTSMVRASVAIRSDASAGSSTALLLRARAAPSREALSLCAIGPAPSSMRRAQSASNHYPCPPPNPPRFIHNPPPTRTGTQRPARVPRVPRTAHVPRIPRTRTSHTHTCDRSQRTYTHARKEQQCSPGRPALSPPAEASELRRHRARP